MPLATLKVGVEVAASLNLHHDVQVHIIFKDVDQTDDVRMLAHLEDVDLHLEEFLVLRGHILLLHDFNGDGVALLHVHGTFYEAKFTLTECSFHFVVVEEVAVANYFLDSVRPLLLLLDRLEVVNARLITGIDQFEAEQLGHFVELLVRLISKENAVQAVH